MPLIATIAPAFDKRGGGRDRHRGERFERHRAAPSALLQPNFGAAFGAGIWLSVEAAAGWVAVLGEASRAHLERRHARRGAVVGDGPKDRKPGAAKRAIRKRIAIAPVRKGRECRRGRQGRWPRPATTLVVTAPLRLATIRKSTPAKAPGKWGRIRWCRSGPREGDLGRAARLRTPTSAAGYPKTRISTPSLSFLTVAGQPEALWRSARPWAGTLRPRTRPRTRMDTPLDLVYCVQPPPSQCDV